MQVMFLLGSVVGYTIGTKEKLLRIESDLIAKDTPVSSSVTKQMASNIRSYTGADIGLALTGYADNF